MGGANKLGTPVSIANGNQYTCPSDGYAYLNQSTVASGYISISNNSQNMALSGSANIAPVKQGWVLRFQESGTVYAVQFIPLVV